MVYTDLPVCTLALLHLLPRLLAGLASISTQF
jgi:hypothetical protein